MPIRPEEKQKYPKDWPAISHSIRERAGNQCEECGVGNYALGGRLPDGKWCPAEPTGCNSLYVTWPRPGDSGWCAGGHRLKIIRIVLTVGHLNHQPEDCRPENLRAWCQRCHLRYDAAHKRTGMKARARAQCAAGDLFDH